MISLYIHLNGIVLCALVIESMHILLIIKRVLLLRVVCMVLNEHFILLWVSFMPSYAHLLRLVVHESFFVLFQEVNELLVFFLNLEAHFKNWLAELVFTYYDLLVTFVYSWVYF